MTITAKKISDPTTDKPYFILTELLEDKADFEESQINVRITDGAHFWRKEGEAFTHQNYQSSSRLNCEGPGRFTFFKKTKSLEFLSCKVSPSLKQ